MKKTYKELNNYLEDQLVKPSKCQKYLIVKTDLVDEVTEAIDGVEVIQSPNIKEKAIIICEWNVANSHALSDLKVSSVSPILRDYDFAGSLKPFKHQYNIASFLAAHKRAFCLSDMGTGKTLATIYAINYLIEIGEIKKALIICPLSVMRNAWEYTIPLVKGNIKSEVIYAITKDKRIQILEESDANIHIINPDGIEILSKNLEAQEYDLIVIDELTTYKTHTTVRWKFLNRLTLRAKYVWGLTGTPVPNSPLDAYGQIKIVAPLNLEGISHYTFKSLVNRETTIRSFYSTEEDDLYYKPEEEKYLEVVYKFFNPAIRIRKDDCLDLPDVVNIFRHCELSKEQRDYYNAMRNEGIIYLKNGTYINCQSGAGYMSKVLQILSGSVYYDDKQTIELEYTKRLEETISLIKIARSERTLETNGKSLVFVPYRSTLDRLHRELSKHFKVAKINSDVKEKERTAILHKLQNTTDIEVIVAIPTTMSHGITATSASLIIWFSPIYSCETYIQACNRINRAGQVQKMTIAHLYGSEIEARIYKALQDKELDQKRLLSFYHEFVKGE